MERLKEGGGGGSEGGEEVKEGEGEGEREGEGGEEKEGPLPVKTSVELYVDVEKIEVRLLTYMLINVPTNIVSTSDHCPCTVCIHFCISIVLYRTVLLLYLQVVSNDPSLSSLLSLSSFLPFSLSPLSAFLPPTASLPLPLSRFLPSLPPSLPPSLLSLPPLQVSDLARECLLSLTAPVNSPHWIREELRITGGLDILANMGEGEGVRE